MGILAVIDLSAELLKMIEARSHPRFVRVVVWSAGLAIICGAVLLLGAVAIRIGNGVKELYHVYTGHPAPVNWLYQFIGVFISLAFYIAGIILFNRWYDRRARRLRADTIRAAEELFSIVVDCRAFTDANHRKLHADLAEVQKSLATAEVAERRMNDALAEFPPDELRRIRELVKVPPAAPPPTPTPPDTRA